MSETDANLQQESVAQAETSDDNKLDKPTSPEKETGASDLDDTGARKTDDEGDNKKINSDSETDDKLPRSDSGVTDPKEGQHSQTELKSHSILSGLKEGHHSGTELRSYSILSGSEERHHSEKLLTGPTEGDHTETQAKESLLQHRESRSKIICVSTSPDEQDIHSETMETTTKDTASSNDVNVHMGGQGTLGAVVTSEPVATGPPGAFELKPKPPLQRRKSLNPRMMTPPGLEILSNKAMVAVRQQMDMDILAGCGGPNTYKIWDINDEQLFFAAETSGCLCRWACGPNRRFHMDVFSTMDDPVLNFHRSCCRCDCCCCLDCFLCLQKLYVVDSLGRTLGSIRQKFSVFNAKFDIVDHDNNILFKLLGPCCPCRCSTEIYFQIFNKTGERQIGRIQKKWGGDRTDEINVDHEYFEVIFPATLDNVDKALVIGAAFLVNFMYLEMS